jgi:hypothetical protein
MNAKNFIFHKSSKREIIKSLIKILPWSGASIFLHNLIIKSIYSGNLSGLMISPQQDDVLWILKLITKQELNSLNRVIATVNKISNENVARPR